MAKQREGVYERILQCAGKEFLEKGYSDASLRIIAQAANTSTGSIYTRFGDKKGLFDALTADAVKELMGWFQKSYQEYNDLPAREQNENAMISGEAKFEEFVDYLYDHLTEFRLILCCSGGTGYGDLVSQLVEMDTEFTYRFIETVGSDAVASGRLTESLMHMLSSSFYSGVFEPVIRGMDREEAHMHVRRLRRFFLCGWADILRLKTEETGSSNRDFGQAERIGDGND